MRFSAIFQISAVPQQDAEAAPRESGPAESAMAAAPGLPAGASPRVTELPELPDELDARVRLVGEWQLGESC